MGKIRQKKKNRSELPKARPKNRGVIKSGRKKINVLGNAIIANNWLVYIFQLPLLCTENQCSQRDRYRDRNQTLTQNYRRLGLVHRLNAPAGGSERRATDDGYEEQPEDNLHIRGSAKATTGQLAAKEAKVERDPETGKIIRVIHDDDEIEVAGRKHRGSNPLNDPLDNLANEEDRVEEMVKQGNAGSGIVKQLERQAVQEGHAVEGKKPRHMSKQEQEWVERLVARHGDNIGAMVRDMKLNPMQQSAGDLKRRIRKWKESQGQA